MTKQEMFQLNAKQYLHGFEAESKEEKVKSVIVDPMKATGMTEEYTIDCPAIPITDASVDFQNMKIRDRHVRSANMRKIELDGRRIKISPVWKQKKDSTEKDWDIHMSYEKKSITIDGQLIAKIDTTGKLRYNKYEDVDEEVQTLMKKWLSKNS